MEAQIIYLTKAVNLLAQKVAMLTELVEMEVFNNSNGSAGSKEFSFDQ